MAVVVFDVADSAARRVLRTTLMSSSSSSSSSGAIAVETLPSTCTWTQHRGANGSCALAPRSCYNCLNTKPTSGESCTLTPEGVCMAAVAYNATLDYRRSWPAGRNYFPAQNATYCEPSDVACASCRGTSFKKWKEYPSQYCKGFRECVCVSICENDEWLSEIQPTLRQALNDAKQNGSFANCTIEEIKTQDENSTPWDAGTTLTDFVGLGPTQAVFANNDPCMWIQNQTFCGAPRSCYDCLNTPLYSGTKCMLHSSGYCTSMASYDLKKDYRKANTTNSIALFPSTNTTYCPRSDATCLQCRQDPTFTQWKGVTSPPQYCTGTDGCVCLASCESPQWQQSVVELACNRTAVERMIDGTDMYKLSPIAFWSVSALSLLGAMICALLSLSCVKRCQQRHAERHRRPPRLPRGPTLELSGWKAMREKLIETEREFVGETHLDGRLRAHSADSVDPETEPPSSESPRTPEPSAELVVEEGDAYRPVSPSRMHL